jgi:hypothetical protein
MQSIAGLFLFSTTTMSKPSGEETPPAEPFVFPDVPTIVPDAEPLPQRQPGQEVVVWQEPGLPARRVGGRGTFETGDPGRDPFERGLWRMQVANALAAQVPDLASFRVRAVTGFSGNLRDAPTMELPEETPGVMVPPAITAAAHEILDTEALEAARTTRDLMTGDTDLPTFSGTRKIVKVDPTSLLTDVFAIEATAHAQAEPAKEESADPEATDIETQAMRIVAELITNPELATRVYWELGLAHLAAASDEGGIAARRDARKEDLDRQAHIAATRLFEKRPSEDLVERVLSGLRRL